MNSKPPVRIQGRHESSEDSSSPFQDFTSDAESNSAAVFVNWNVPVSIVPSLSSNLLVRKHVLLVLATIVDGGSVISNLSAWVASIVVVLESQQLAGCSNGMRVSEETYVVAEVDTAIPRTRDPSTAVSVDPT